MIDLFKVFMSKQVDSELLKVLHSGMITQNTQVQLFEKKLSEYFNHPYVLTLNSATSGLTLATRLISDDAKDGTLTDITVSQILSTPLTCVATNFAIMATNPNNWIIWVDVDKDTCNMNLNDLEQKISQYTRIVMVVHWGGVPIDLNRLRYIIETANAKFNIDIKVIEDCSHAFGSIYDGKKIGTHGNICVFSFQAIKHLTTGDGGLIVLPTLELYNRAKLLRWYGIDREQRNIADSRIENNITEWGYKFHMNDINATIGLNNLPFIENNIAKHRYNATYYNKHLSDIPGVILNTNSIISIPSYWIYTLRVVNRQSFIQFMKNNGITTSQVHTRNDRHDCLSQFKSELPILNSIENEVVCIPVGWWITHSQLKFIVSKIKEWSSIYFNIRLIEQNDLIQYQQLISDLVKVNRPPNIAHFKSIVKDKTTYMLRCEGNIIGTGKVYVETKLFDNMAHIENVIIDYNYRQLHYGKFLIHYLTSLCSDCYKIVLSCDDGNVDFYRQCGFTFQSNQMVKRNNI